MVRPEVRERLALGAVAVGVLAVSASAVFIRLAEAPALGIAFWRSALGAVVLLLPLLYSGQGLPRGRALRVSVVSGLLLGAHFGLWISSLDYTSVAASVVLVSVHPVFVAVLALVFLGERTRPVVFGGIALAIAGTAVIAFQGGASGQVALAGNALALAGALTVAMHLLIGRGLRQEGMGVLSYSVVVYSASAAGLLPVALLLGEPLWGYDAPAWLWIAMIVLGPQILGHTAFNWALRYLPAPVVSGTILAEPVGAALLAWAVLSEHPGAATVAGGTVVLMGLFMIIRGREGKRSASVR